MADDAQRLSVTRASGPGDSGTASTLTTGGGPWLLAGLVVAALLVATSIWAYGAIERTVREQVGAVLDSLLDARVAALDTWFEDQARVARMLAAAPELKAELAALRAGDAQARERTAAWLAQRGESLGQACALLVDSGGECLLGEGRLLAPERLAPVIGGRSLLLPRSAGKASSVLLAVPVTDPESGAVVAALALGFEPARLTDLMGHPGGEDPSGETLLVDGEGRLVSHSAHLAQLRAAGLVEGEAALELVLRDPGVDLTAGHAAPTGDGPLTLLASELVRGRSGRDLEGYRSVLGRSVVGAWHWLDGPRLGVGVELDRERAFRALVPLRVVCAALISLLAALGAGVLTLGWHSRRVGRRAAAAERRAERMGQYSLGEKIGEGGMSEVYRAQHLLLRRPTAVKLLRADRRGGRALERFEREVRQTSRLVHPNTISIYDYGHAEDGTFFYAMELVEGLTLADLVRAAGPLDEGRVIHLLVQVCGSLAEAHALGLVHRDVKPGNVLVCARAGLYDLVKVLDFGLVKDVEHGDTELTRAGTLTGTPQYISPEAIRDPASVDARSDLYAVGCVAWFLLTGRPVFRAGSLPEIIAAHLEQEPERPSEHRERPVDADLEQIVLECLAKDRDRRPAGAVELARRLAACRSAGTWGSDEARAWWTARGEPSLEPTPVPGGGPTTAGARPGPDGPRPVEGEA